jgi:hypothetical protein
MSSPDIELLSTRRISLPHLGHLVRDNFDAGVRRYLSVIQEGNFICDSYRLVAASRRATSTAPWLSAAGLDCNAREAALIYRAAAQC